MPILRIPFEPEEDELTRLRNERFVEVGRGGAPGEPGGLYVDFSWPPSLSVKHAVNKARIALSLDNDETMIEVREDEAEAEA